MLHSSKKSSLLTPKIGTKNIYAPINMLIGVTIIIASIFNGVISHSPYEPSDIGKNVLLIDGQQRITTISLLLLAVYCKDSDQDSKDAYRKEYFKNSLPKLDYKVRETAHDFTVSFIDFALSHENTNFKQSSEYYDIYSKDVTANSILENYQTILKFIEDNQILENRKNFLDYLENYIEFNYFDTNLSEQGERLYLYMNSCGEELSEQENVKALLISKRAAKN